MTSVVDRVTGTRPALPPPSDLTALSAGVLASLVARREVSAREIVQAHIRRIEDVDRRLNAVIFRRFDRALDEADETDAGLRRGAAPRPLTGVPITVKDQFLVADTPTTLGLPSRASHRASSDGPSIRRLRAAGAIVLGKTNVGQLLMYHESVNPLFGRTNNPWDPDRTPGGSSGGEAAIIAAGGSPLGLGGDFGGSTRIPAHFCGIAGLRPTSRRLSLLDTPSDFFCDQDLISYQPGPMARHVSDLILAMEVLTSAEYGPTDASAQATAWPDPAGVRVGSLRVGLYDHDGWFPASPAIRRAVAEAGAALADRGATVVTFRPPAVEPALTLFIAAAGADGLRTMRRVLRDEPVDPHLKGFLAVSRTPRPLRPVLAAVLDAAGRPHYALPVRASGPWSPAQMARLRDELERYVTGFGAALDASGVDVLISPPFAVPALTHGAGVDLTAHTAGSYATLYSTLGLPSGVVPITRVRAGEESDRPSSGVLSRAARDVETGSAALPVGVQIAARAWRDDLVLAVMAALESDLVARAEYPRTPVA